MKELIQANDHLFVSTVIKPLGPLRCGKCTSVCTLINETITVSRATNAQECKVAWRSLRQSYRYHCKTAHTRLQQDDGDMDEADPLETPDIQWEFAEDMSFLQDLLRNRDQSLESAQLDESSSGNNTLEEYTDMEYLDTAYINNCDDDIEVEDVTVTIADGAPCKLCTAAFSTTAELNNHQRIHDNVRPYPCRYACGKSFRHCSNRSTHERVHMAGSLRPFQCDYCNKTFVTKGDCRSHQMVHTMSRNFSCDICEQSFKLHKHYLQHLNTKSHKKTEEKSLKEKESVA
ncbi:hypothetical protein AWZ03_004009 [Drosophila navojoa]|uniref:C2H2-type domain-containing protein n=1 Tax=Drosophila navojoa TaxID=7232 RepID=A0A484BLA5_DRONA|nr:hypothetical protein AWZ03_004009 [Drosophila navojoa]